MSNRSFNARRSVAVSVVLALALTAQAPAQDKPAALDDAIRDYILRNPQVIKEALDKATRTEEVDRTKRILREHRDEIYRGGSPMMGKADAKISIVAFFDYNCPYCRKIHPDLRKAVAENTDVRIVLKDIANLGKDSEAVARLAIAAAQQGKHEPLHEALMSRQGKNTEASALETARTLGLNIELLKKDAVSSKTTGILARTQQLASHLSVEGTPLLIIGHNGIAGAPDTWMSQLKQYVELVRSDGCDVC